MGLLVGLWRCGRLDLMGERRTLCGEGTSLLKEDGGITPRPTDSSSRMFLARVALWPGLFLVVSEEIRGRGMFSGALNSWEDISLTSRLQQESNRSESVHVTVLTRSISFVNKGEERRERQRN